MYSYGNIRLEIPPQVFHPGFFFSTRLLLRYISGLSLQGQRFLELGAGSGLISIYAARKGATVTATDINPVAVECLHKNFDQNKVTPEIILSDLFAEIPEQSFDIIAINPPYYKKKPVSQIDHAWFCGENGEYFSKLFQNLNEYMHSNSQVLMVLCDGCDMPMIRSFALENGFQMNCVHMKRNMVEMNFIYQIEKSYA